ncbi:MAG TPA: hypothetical protein VKV22_04140 [Rhodanobacteraceae bacterium]|nr:hypothetical protein [Rhodanobacteraceae bacterium]
MQFRLLGNPIDAGPREARARIPVLQDHGQDCHVRAGQVRIAARRGQGLELVDAL